MNLSPISHNGISQKTKVFCYDPYYLANIRVDTETCDENPLRTTTHKGTEQLIYQLNQVQSN